MSIEPVINQLIGETKADTNLISDGYHTFGELYAHRIALFIALCRIIEEHEDYRLDRSSVWRSQRHSDGELAFGGGWFVLGLGYEPGKLITYHLPLSDWDKTDFAVTLEKAPEWDGHTPADVVERLGAL